MTEDRPQIVSFAAWPWEVPLGEPATLRWVIVGADEVVIEPGVGTVDPSSGSVEVHPTAPTSYFVIAKGGGREIVGDAFVGVVPVMIDEFAVTPSVVACGGLATLGWTTYGASECSIDNGVGRVPASGSVYVTPAQSTTYTLRAEGYEPRTATATIEVMPVITALELHGVVKAEGVSARLAWGTVGATFVELAGLAVPLWGAAEVDCSGAPFDLVATAGTQSAPVSLKVICSGDPHDEFGAEISLRGGLNVDGAEVSVDWRLFADGSTGGWVRTGAGDSYPVAGDRRGHLEFVSADGPPYLWSGLVDAIDASGAQVSMAVTFPPYPLAAARLER